MMLGKHSRLLYLFGAAILLAASVAFISRRIQRNERVASQLNPPRHDVPAEPQPEKQSVIPPAPPLAESLPSPEPVANLPADNQAVSSMLAYDMTQSFAANLERFRLFCETDADPRTLEGRTSGFVKELIKRAKANGPTIKETLLAKQGSPSYRNVLLACLLQCDLDDKQDVAWSIALDQVENASVRRTAAFVLIELTRLRGFGG
jgi:hypothetical protein